jgi:hypothetical protein
MRQSGPRYYPLTLKRHLNLNPASLEDKAELPQFLEDDLVKRPDEQ